MTDQERQQVLKMIENGTISPEDGLKLMETLDRVPVDEATGIVASPQEEGSIPGQEKAEEKPAEQAERSSFEFDPRIEKVKSTVASLWQIPLWIGIFITVMSAWGMSRLVALSRINFWFFFLFLPLLIGVLIIVAAIGSRRARWLFVDVHQKPGEKPARIFLGFPLPLRLASWFLRTFGNSIPGIRDSNVDMNGVVQFLDTGFKVGQPLVVNVDEGEEGERVKVYIG
jgi:hypothetical protein